ncbi:dTDP-glucose 4,6-dehydratase [Limnochorda pilosa]|uniref:dTDP-glucose 4,6-dehydratase n=1 Tax=Limnochorda pilosa TaxID=1555112 RepID=A0A0K2SLG8_LIMPI|nr:dTDP-glucose 4,6-dehydratase [Limnochorda pilosa]BAS27971.1 spore coat protein [Limnochorda pilosa]
MIILITGGAGFIGSNFVHHLLREHPEDKLVNLDLLTYAGNLENLTEVEGNERYRFVQSDVADPEGVERAFAAAEEAWGSPVDAVVHFAAESHVDRSIEDASAFLRTNVIGTQVLLEAARRHGVERFVQVSTDEVYGSLTRMGAFTEESPIAPNSPYAASKAAADLMVRAAWKTHGFPALITRCSNNYGPYQFPEKLIPLMIANALEGKPLPVYGDGQNVRDWIHVEDHCRGIDLTLRRGRPGEVYNFGGHAERPNLEVVRTLLRILDRPENLIRFVPDRPGHDRRYAMDSSKSERELGWRPRWTFEEGLESTVNWYLSHQDWLERVRSGAYREYYTRMYDRREDWLDALRGKES